MIDARTTSKGNLRMISFFSRYSGCPACLGTRMSRGVSNIRISGHTLAEAGKLPIHEMFSFIKSLRQSVDAHEFNIAGPIVSHLEPRLFYLNKIGLRTLPLVITRSRMYDRIYGLYDMIENIQGNPRKPSFEKGHARFFNGHPSLDSSDGGKR